MSFAGRMRLVLELILSVVISPEGEVGTAIAWEALPKTTAPPRRMLNLLEIRLKNSLNFLLSTIASRL